MRSLREHRLTVETVYATASEITERLLSGELDCIIMPEAAIKGLRHLRRYVFHEAQPRIMLPKSHPLFSRESIALRELSDSQFVFYDTKELPSVFVQQVQNCRENGFEPRIAAYGDRDRRYGGV